MEIFPGGSRNLEALPGVGRAAVQQLRPGYVVLARDADLPVAVDHKLGAAVLEGWKKMGDGGVEGVTTSFYCAGEEISKNL